MGLFDKKYCDVCGEKISLLGNRKLEDGNLCKDCARKLSPFFSERRSSTVEEIKQQLAYREENERRLADFRPDMTFGDGKKVYVDRNGAQFIVTSSSNWRNANPDLIAFSQVTGVNTDIHENKQEIYYKDDEGNRRSYNPRRYECNYEFNVTILVNSPWFDKIELELSDGSRPDSPYTDLYRHYEQQMHTLASILNGSGAAQAGGFAQGGGFSAPKSRKDELVEQALNNISWVCSSCQMSNNGTKCRNCGAPISDKYALEKAEALAQAQMMMENASANQGSAPAAQANAVQSWSCPSCGSQNTGKFCEGCGAPKPAANIGACSKCGYVLPANAPAPKFCPECGAPLSR